MNIEYYDLECGHIIQKIISIDDYGYVSHDDQQVVLLVPYINEDGFEDEEQRSFPRNYEILQQNRIDLLLSLINDFQEELKILRSSLNYEHYRELLIQNTKK